jgi:MoaA/NifB/PqqE/SkfB family radical SAM enzyme
MLLYVDVIDACHLKCPTCARGVRAFPNTPKKMSLSMFRDIVNKAVDDGAYKVDIFSWIEPFLCRNLHEYITIVKNAGLPCGVSSTLSLRNINQFESAICAMDTLTISISGFEQKIYEINHVGGRIEWVKQNLERLGELKRSGAASVNATLRMLMFDYNRGEEPKLRALAESVGIGFEVLLAEGHPVRLPQSREGEAEVLTRMHEFSPNRPHESTGEVCPLIFEHVTINADGDVYQCTAYGNFEVMKIGAFLELTREEVLLRRYTHPVCNSCPWSRRAVAPLEMVLLQQAMAARLGEQIVNRVPRLSTPVRHPVTTSDGFLVQKSKQFMK